MGWADGRPSPWNRTARTCLGPAAGRGLVVHTILAFLLLTASASLYVIAAFRPGGQ